MESLALAALAAKGYDPVLLSLGSPEWFFRPIFVQSFEVGGVAPMGPPLSASDRRNHPRCQLAAAVAAEVGAVLLLLVQRGGRSEIGSYPKPFFFMLLPTDWLRMRSAAWGPSRPHPSERPFHAITNRV